MWPKQNETSVRHAEERLFTKEEVTVNSRAALPEYREVGDTGDRVSCQKGQAWN